MIEISGRTYTGKGALNRPPVDENLGERDDAMQLAISPALDELARAGRGDFLVLLSSERKICEAVPAHRPPSTEISAVT